MNDHMQRSKIQKMIKNIFALLCFVFTSFLLFAVIYETVVTEELPSDNKQTLDTISDKYSFLPKVFGSDENEMGLDENEEFEDEADKHNKGWYDD